MRLRRPIRAAALPFLILLPCLGPSAAPAAAAVPFQVGVGEDPDVAVAPNGTAHIVWSSRPIGAEQVHYCQVPRGARACGVRRTVTPPGTGDTPAVLLSGNSIFIVASRLSSNPSGTFLYTSANGGQSFSGPTRIGTLGYGLDDAVLGPGGAISGVNQIDGYQRMPLSGLPLPTGSVKHGGFRSVALFQGQIPVVASAEGSSYYDGTGDHNDTMNWTGVAPHVPATEGEVRLAGGPQGVVLLYRSRGALIARKFTGNSFSAGVRVSEVGDPTGPGLFADAATGVFHAVWQDNRAPNEVRWAVSADGVRWSGPHTLVREDDVFHTRVSAAPDRQGFAVWDRNSIDGPVRAAALEPLTATTEPGIVGGPTSSSRRTTLIDGIAVELSLALPRSCIPRPSRLRARLTARQIKRLTRSLRRRLKARRLKRGGFKIMRVDFKLDGRAAGTDRRRPFEVVLGTAGLPAGRHAVAATVHIKRTSVRRVRGKRRTVLGKRTYRRALTKGFNVCG